MSLLIRLQLSCAVCVECQPPEPRAINMTPVVATCSWCRRIDERKCRQNRAGGNAQIREPFEAGADRRGVMIKGADRKRNSLRQTQERR